MKGERSAGLRFILALVIVAVVAIVEWFGWIG